MKRGSTWSAVFAVSAFFLAAESAMAKSPLAGCDAFIANLRKVASDLQVDFAHSIIVSRAKSAANVFDVMDLDPRAGLVLRISGGPTVCDLVLFRARTWTELFARPQTDRVVLRNGIAIDTTLPDYRELDDLMEA